MRIIWKEMKEWKKHWSWGRFFLVLTFGLGASLFDFGSDFNFAWSVEDDCGFEKTERYDFDSPCGSVHYKNVERLTFTFVAFPGIFLSFAVIHRVAKELVGLCQGGEAQRVGVGLARASVITFEVCAFLGLFVAALWSDQWSKTVKPSTVKVYDYTIQALAFLSATLALGVKIVGLFCHGPESCRLVFRAKDRESKFEANFQLGLLTSMYTSSGYATPASMLSAISAIIVISKTGVQNLMQRHEKKLSETSVLGKICVAASALPVFLLVNAFKIGFRSYIRTWNAMISLVAGTSLIVLPNLALIILKMQNQFQEMTFTSLNPSVISECLGMHLWPKAAMANE